MNRRFLEYSLGKVGVFCHDGLRVKDI